MQRAQDLGPGPGAYGVGADDAVAKLPAGGHWDPAPQPVTQTWDGKVLYRVSGVLRPLQYIESMVLNSFIILHRVSGFSMLLCRVSGTETRPRSRSRELPFVDRRSVAPRNHPFVSVIRAVLRLERRLMFAPRKRSCRRVV